MLDLLGIMFSSLMMLLVIIRAVQLDMREPWFGSPKGRQDNSGLRVGNRAEAPPSGAEGQPPPTPEPSRTARRRGADPLR